MSEASSHVNVTINGTFTPKPCKIREFSVPARKYAPSLVFSIVHQVPKHTSSDTTMIQPRYMGKYMKPRFTPPCNASGIEYGIPDEPKICVNVPCNTSAIPKVSNKPYKWSSCAIGRIRNRSITIPNKPTAIGTTISADQ